MSYISTSKRTARSHAGRMTIIATAMALTLGLAACTTNPYTGEQQASKAATYGANSSVTRGIVLIGLTKQGPSDRSRLSKQLIE